MKIKFSKKARNQQRGKERGHERKRYLFKFESSIIKTDVENVVIAPVLIPNEEDLNGDTISAEEIQKTAYEFISNLQNKEVNIDHEGEEIEGVEFVETYISPIDIDFGDGEIIPVGSWIIGIRLPEELYQQALDGEFVGISMEGFGIIEQN